MSKLTDFFGGGSESGIPVEILGVSGSGGTGRLAPTPGPCTISNVGGAGAIFHATNYSVAPGVTVPITIGAGGAAGTACPPGLQPNSPPGSIGGSTCFNYPKLPLCVIGGGGGQGVSCAPSPGPCVRSTCLDGGNGGGLRFIPEDAPCVKSYTSQDNCAIGRYNVAINRESYVV